MEYLLQFFELNHHIHWSYYLLLVHFYFLLLKLIKIFFLIKDFTYFGLFEDGLEGDLDINSLFIYYDLRLDVIISFLLFYSSNKLYYDCTLMLYFFNCN